MSDTTTPRSTPVHVVGGGLAGLAAAALVADAGHDVTVHESRYRLGGRATTDERAGFRFNQGPHAFYRGGDGERVLRRLGVDLRGEVPLAKGAMAVDDGRLELLPTGPASLARTGLLSAKEKIEFGRLLLRLPKLDPSAFADRTASQFVDDVASRDRVRDVLHMLIRLTSYVNAPDHLSAEVVVTQVRAALDAGVIYLDRGWEQLVDALSVRPRIHFARGDRLTELPDAASVIVAVGGPEATAALTGHPYEGGIEAAARVLDLSRRRPAEHDFLLGLDRPLYASNHSIAADMAPAGASSLSVAAYLRPGEPAPERDELRTFAGRAGMTPDDVVDERYLHHMTVVSSIATADRGGLVGRPPVDVPGRPGVFIAGDWVGPRGHMADAVLASAEQAAEAAVRHLARRPVSR